MATRSKDNNRTTNVSTIINTDTTPLKTKPYLRPRVKLKRRIRTIITRSKRLVRHNTNTTQSAASTTHKKEEEVLLLVYSK